MKHFIFLSLVSFSVWANEVQLELQLSPAGHFFGKSQEIKVEGNLTKTQEGFKAEDITLPIASITTGIALRDEHLKKKYLESDTFPKAKLIKATGKGGVFEGQLQVHGVTQPISGTFLFRDNNLEVYFTCRISDFKIEEPRYMGIGVDNDVKVKVTLRTKSS